MKLSSAASFGTSAPAMAAHVAITSVKLSIWADSDFVYSSDAGGRVLVWRRSNWKKVRGLDHMDPAHSVYVDDDYIYVGCGNYEARSPATVRLPSGTKQREVVPPYSEVTRRLLWHYLSKVMTCWPWMLLVIR